MPPEQAFRCERPVIVLRRVQHHFHDALDVTVRRPQPADVDSEPASDRRAHLLGIQLFAFDLAAFQNVFGESAENGLLSNAEAESLHLADQPTLQVPACGQRGR